MVIIICWEPSHGNSERKLFYMMRDINSLERDLQFVHAIDWNIPFSGFA
jgi:hypothetical protein